MKLVLYIAFRQMKAILLLRLNRNSTGFGKWCWTTHWHYPGEHRLKRNK